LICLNLALVVADESVLEETRGINTGPILFLVILITVLFNLRLKASYVALVIPVLGYLALNMIYHCDHMERAHYNSILMSSGIYLLFTVHFKYLDRKILSRSLTVFLFVCLILTIYLRVRGFYFVPETYERLYASGVYGRFGHLQGFFSNSNRAGMFFVASAQLALAFIHHPLIRFSLFGIYSFLTFFTLSRTSISALVIFIVIYYLVFTRLSWNRLLRIVLISIILGIAIILTFFSLFPREGTLLIQKTITSGFSGRNEIWSEALQTATASPENFLFGIGPNAFQYYVAGRGGSEWALSAHNAYLDAMTNLGFPFVLLSLFFVFFIFFDQVKKRRSIFIPFFVSALLYGLFENNILTNPNIIWLTLPMVIQIASSQDPAET
jgi:O-antigen ligase